VKRVARYLAMVLLGSLAVGAQAGQSGHSNRPDSQAGSSTQTERPTLRGPRAGPRAEVARPTATTADIRRLLRVRTIYVENIDNSLSDKLIEALAKWGRFRLVTKAKDADALLRGSCLESRHLKHVHSEIYISDHNGRSLGQDTVYRPYNPPTLDQAVEDTAQAVAAHLQLTVSRGERE